MYGGDSKGNTGLWIAIIIVGVIAIVGTIVGVLYPSKPKSPMTSWMGSSKLGTASDYIADGSVYQTQRGNDLFLPKDVRANYENMIRPPPTTTFVPGTDGGSCAVSTVNNCSPDLYYKCEQKAWSPDAIGEGLALAAVGSYYVPSDVEDANLYKVISLAHDPVTAGCANAANLPPYNPNSPVQP